MSHGLGYLSFMEIVVFFRRASKASLTMGDEDTEYSSLLDLWIFFRVPQSSIIHYARCAQLHPVPQVPPAASRRRWVYVHLSLYLRLSFIIISR